ncbi:MAG: hypothetical protein GF308_21925 [Candidatus Heimdallarchaeota archaeon]|nr:hypothetical protein [Candidatus Heimdallarchaeota archaeon]
MTEKKSKKIFLFSYFDGENYLVVNLEDFLQPKNPIHRPTDEYNPSLSNGSLILPNIPTNNLGAWYQPEEEHLWYSQTIREWYRENMDEWFADEPHFDRSPPDFYLMVILEVEKEELYDPYTRIILSVEQEPTRKGVGEP